MIGGKGFLSFDVDGRRLIDLHLNGGTYNLGHRHPELVEVLKAGTERFDMKSSFSSISRTALAELYKHRSVKKLQIYSLWIWWR
ncbi:MAG: hypothetical protein CM15mP109_14840 [Candidatus Dadabacteria bacterium]|nr:MAG: hypothetical protein CM15mP109_14840 [Candidatus Dadabacteria bacterium]